MLQRRTVLTSYVIEMTFWLYAWRFARYSAPLADPVYRVLMMQTRTLQKNESVDSRVTVREHEPMEIWLRCTEVSVLTVVTVNRGLRQLHVDKSRPTHRGQQLVTELLRR